MCSTKQNYTWIHYIGFHFVGALPQRSIRSHTWRAFVVGYIGTCRQGHGKFRRDLTITRYVTHTTALPFPSGEWRARVFRRTPGNSSAGQLRFVNQFCASTIKPRTSMLHLPILTPFANRIVDLCVNHGRNIATAYLVILARFSSQNKSETLAIRW